MEIKKNSIGKRHIIKEEIIKVIMKSIKRKDYTITKEEVINFVENFQKQYNRLPVDDEIPSIVKSYIIMRKQDNDLITQKSLLKDQDKSIKHLTIKKPNGRRQCPNCNGVKIMEKQDKTEVISHFPPVFGRIFKCGKCGCEWKEK